MFSSLRNTELISINNPLFQALVFAVLGLILGVVIVFAGSLESLSLTVIVIFGVALGLTSLLIKRIEFLVFLGFFIDTLYPFDVALFYRSDLDNMASLPGIMFSVSTILIFISYLLWLIHILKGKRKSKPKIFYTLIPSVIYFACVSLSAINAIDIQPVIFELAQIIQLILIYFYVIGNVNSDADIIRIMTLLSVVVLSQAILIIYLYFQRSGFVIFALIARVDVVGDSVRVGGTIGGPNGAGGLLATLLIPIISLLFCRVSRKVKFLAGVTALTGIVALIFTFSRGAWTGFMLGLLIFIAWAFLTKRLSKAQLVAMLVITMIMISIFSTIIVRRLTQSNPAAVEDRIPLLYIAQELISERPIIGNGAGNFVLLVKSQATELGGIWLSNVHNKYFLLWSETGIIGLLSFLIFLGSILITGLYYIRNYLQLSPLVFGIVCGIVVQMIHMNFDIYNSRPPLQAFWMLSSFVVVLTLNRGYSERRRAVVHS